MGDTDTDMIHTLHSSFSTTSIPKHHSNHIQFSTDTTSTKRLGVPPPSPYSQIQNINPGGAAGATHSRSMSQPSSFFSFDSLPPLSPFRDHNNNNNNHSPYTRCNSLVTGESCLPPRKSHRRSNSDIPICFPPISGGESPTPYVKKEEAMDDDLFSAYMNLETIDALNSSETADENNVKNNGKDESRASGGTSDDTEGDSSSVNYESGDNTLKRRAIGGGDIAPTTNRHYRSVSVDSCFMEKFSFGEESSLKPPLSPGTVSRKVSPTNSVVDGGAAAFSIEFKNGEFTAAEMKKIMANDKLTEMAMSDPKRVKRILANRQSAARSKERKMRYIVELEHKVQTLQTEATTLSAQFTLLQRDMMGLTNENNELKFRLQAMEQQAQLRDALNEALNGEVQRLKLANGETRHNESDRLKMKSLNAEMFQQLHISQLTQQPQSQHSHNGTMSAKPESNEL
ncbi:unnamed protein product [Eruca vesicaria subsp. sativa]|uniref:BZIP domain-containing protein n=1 Tax=Eruca vesicaria subsp. sativa TaxID=29727 RepID=A0ABC8L6L2_ERUVS|nr:unnamed protein product [Eruca vesicaria subsp. sativa]